jgi:hypothetical protein
VTASDAENGPDSKDVVLSDHVIASAVCVACCWKAAAESVHVNESENDGVKPNCTVAASAHVIESLTTFVIGPVTGRETLSAHVSVSLLLAAIPTISDEESVQVMASVEAETRPRVMLCASDHEIESVDDDAVIPKRPVLTTYRTPSFVMDTVHMKLLASKRLMPSG